MEWWCREVPLDEIAARADVKLGSSTVSNKLLDHIGALPANLKFESTRNQGSMAHNYKQDIKQGTVNLRKR